MIFAQKSNNITVEKFVERLKELRAAKKINRETLAKEIGVSPSIVRYWEDGIKTPKADAIISLSKYFGVTSDYLLGLSDY